MATAAEKQGITKDLVLKSIAFANSCDDAEVQRICDLQTPNQQGLSFSHVRRVLSIKDKKKQIALLEQAAREGWSDRMLSTAAKEITSGISKGGRGPGNTHSTSAALLELHKQSQQWLRNAELAWANSNDGPFARQCREPVRIISKLQAMKLLKKLKVEVLEVEKLVKGLPVLKTGKPRNKQQM